MVGEFPLPNLVLPGAGRSGSTALKSLLASHPDVFMPHKHVGYFSTEFDNGRDWYLSKFRGFDGQKWIGEATTAYIYADGAAERMAQFNPSMHLIFTLRDPVERAYSNHAHERQMWGVRTTFEEGLDESNRYVNPGLYARRLKLFLECFPRSQVHAVILERFVSQPDVVLAEVAQFLQIPTSGFDLGRLERNPATRARIPVLQSWITKVERLQRAPKVVRSAMARARAANMTTEREERAPLTPATTARLQAFFAEDILQLETLLDLDLSVWPSRPSS